MGWTFVYLMLILKIPIVALLWIVWWAIHQTDDAAAEPDGGGGSKRPHPREPLPHTPRRGPHGDPAPAAPPRVRAVTARARRLNHRASSAGTDER